MGITRYWTLGQNSIVLECTLSYLPLIFGCNQSTRLLLGLLPTAELNLEEILARTT